MFSFFRHRSRTLRWAHCVCITVIGSEDQESLAEPETQQARDTEKALNVKYLRARASLFWVKIRGGGFYYSVFEGYQEGASGKLWWVETVVFDTFWVLWWWCYITSPVVTTPAPAAAQCLSYTLTTEMEQYQKLTRVPNKSSRKSSLQTLESLGKILNTRCLSNG